MSEPTRAASGATRRSRSRALVIAGVVVLVACLLVVALLSLRGGAGDASRTGLPRVGDVSVVPQASETGDPGPALVAQLRFPRAGSAQDVLLEQQQDGQWETVEEARTRPGGTASIPLGPGVTPSNGPLRAALLGPTGARVALTKVAAFAPWTEIFADDFDGARLDPRRWTVRQPGDYNEAGSRTCSKSDASAVDVSAGRLLLKVTVDPDRRGEVCRTAEGKFSYYLNGHVGTEETFDFRYGYAEARIRFPRERGQHGAFWLQRDGEIPQVPGDPGSSGAEIDVVEFFGEGYPKGGLAAFVHFLNEDEEGEKVGGLQPRATRALPTGDDWWRSFHDFSVGWTPERYVFRVDGREIFRTSRGVSGVDQFLVLSLLTSDWELADLDDDGLPSSMVVDSVRVWQQRDSPE